MKPQFDYFTSRVVLWPGTPQERVQVVNGSRERKRRDVPASLATLRRFVLAAHELANVPVRIIEIVPAVNGPSDWRCRRCDHLNDGDLGACWECGWEHGQEVADPE